MVNEANPRYRMFDEAPYTEFGMGGGGGGGGTTTDSEMTPDLKSYLVELELWAKANKKDAARDAMAFWMLKIPAIISSVGTGILAYFDLGTFSLFLGVIAGVCVAVDGIHPRGMLRNTHLRAFHDIRILTSTIVTKWRTRSDKSIATNISKRIIKDVEDERVRIANYIRDAETALRHKS